MRKCFAKIKPYLSAIAGALYAWLILGNVFAEIIFYFGEGFKGGCYPSPVWGGYIADCKNIYSEIAWAITLGIPWMALSILYTAGALLLRAINNLSVGYSLEALWWVFVSSPIVLLILIPGFLYWRKRFIVATWLLTAALIVMFAYHSATF